MSRLKHKFDLINHSVYKPRQCVFTDEKVAIISIVTDVQVVISVKMRHLSYLNVYVYNDE